MNFISNFVDEEHNRLDKLYVEFLAEFHNLEKAMKMFDDFKFQLFQHMRMEDEFLFPRLNQYLEMDENTGLAANAAAEHAVIRKLISFVDDARRENNFKKFKIASLNLHQALEKHRNRERELQYPVSDRFITRDEWELILIKVYG